MECFLSCVTNSIRSVTGLGSYTCIRVCERRLEMRPIICIPPESIYEGCLPLHHAYDILLGPSQPRPIYSNPWIRRPEKLGGPINCLSSPGNDRQRRPWYTTYAASCKGFSAPAGQGSLRRGGESLVDCLEIHHPHKYFSRGYIPMVYTSIVYIMTRKDRSLLSSFLLRGGNPRMTTSSLLLTSPITPVPSLCSVQKLQA